MEGKSSQLNTLIGPLCLHLVLLIEESAAEMNQLLLKIAFHQAHCRVYPIEPFTVDKGRKGQLVRVVLPDEVVVIKGYFFNFTQGVQRWRLIGAVLNPLHIIVQIYRMSDITDLTSSLNCQCTSPH